MHDVVDTLTTQPTVAIEEWHVPYLLSPVDELCYLNYCSKIKINCVQQDFDRLRAI